MPFRYLEFVYVEFRKKSLTGPSEIPEYKTQLVHKKKKKTSPTTIDKRKKNTIPPQEGLASDQANHKPSFPSSSAL